jgi:protein subunit release factor B
MRSSGPGGQSVNTTNSKAQVKLSIDQCPAIDTFIKDNLQKKYSNYINKSGELVVTSQVHKSQSSNLK